jgi:hypothetical protein
MISTVTLSTVTLSTVTIATTEVGKMGTYRERLLVPVSYWIIAAPVVVLLGAEAYFFVDGYIPVLTIVVLYVIVAAFLLNWGTATVEVTPGVLRAGRDTLALRDASEVIALNPEQARLLGGPRADPAAHLLLRPYLKRAVCVRLNETAAQAGVPYWLVSTRHPGKLAGAIEAARQTDVYGRPGGDSQPGDWQSVG